MFELTAIVAAIAVIGLVHIANNLLKVNKELAKMLKANSIQDYSLVEEKFNTKEVEAEEEEPELIPLSEVDVGTLKTARFH